MAYVDTLLYKGDFEGEWLIIYSKEDLAKGICRVLGSLVRLGLIDTTTLLALPVSL